MKYDVKILPQAWDDLKTIQDYYVIRFDKETAQNVVNRILDTIQRLDIFPDTGSLPPSNYLAEQGYRMVICEKHIAIYKKFPLEGAVYIYTISDTRTDYAKLFKQKVSDSL